MFRASGEILNGLLVLLLFFPAISGKAQTGGLEPIFKGESRSDIVKILEVSALEPEVRRLTSNRQAASLYKSLLSRLDGLRPDGSPTSKELKRAYIDAASIAFYYLVNTDSGEANSRITQARDWLADFAERFARQTKRSDERRLAKYFYLVAEIGRTNGSSGAITQLVDMKAEFERRNEIVANIDLMIGYSLIQIAATAKQGLSYIEKAPAPSVYGKIAQRLLKAYHEAGLSGRGEKIAEPRSASIKEIRYVIQVAKGLPKGLQNFVLNTAFFIWEKAFKGTYAKPPFSLDGFVAVKPLDSYNEKLALEAFSERRYQDAILAYDKILEGHRGTSTSLLVEKRIWKLEHLRFEKTQNPNGIETRFVRLHERYSKSVRGSSEFKKYAKTFFQKISRHYASIVMQMLTQSYANQNDPQLMVRSIALAEKFLRIETSEKEFVSLRFRLAQVYRKTNQYEKAVDLFLFLAKESPAKMLPYAVEAQSQQARWPLSPPWTQLPDGPAVERAKLATIYERLIRVKKPADWKFIAQLGLLYRATGLHSKVELLWYDSLKEASPGVHPNEASGQLASAFYRTKRWPELIRLVAVVNSRKLAPTLSLKPLTIAPYYADALFNQGHTDLKQRQYQASISNLSGFIKQFPSDKRVPTAYYSLATAYKTTGKLVSALNSLKILVDQFPALSLRKQFLMKGGEWAATSEKTMEYAFYFYGKYLNEFPREANIPQVRDLLASLYFKRSLYGWASRLYKEQSTAQGVPPAMQLAAATRYMEIEEKYGQPQDAAFGANRILQLASPSSPVAGKAFGFLARLAAAKNDMAAMKELEPKLIAIAGKSPDASEALGHIRFKIAELLTQPIQNNQNNTFIKDPEASVKTYFDAFNQQKIHYSLVCQGGMSTLCAPSMLRLLLLTRMTIKAIDQVEIAATLGAARVNAFNVFKQLHRSKLTEVEAYYGKEAVRLAKQGTTTLIWRSEILKTLNDSRFQTAH